MGLILVPLAMTYALEGNPAPLLAIGGLSFMLYVFFILKNGSCALPLIGVFFTGKLNFLPIGLSAMAVLTVALIIYYFFEYFALKQGKISIGPYFLFLPIMVIATIVLYHNHSIGLHALGSSTEGSLLSLLMLLGVIGYFCGTSISPPSPSFLSRLPWYCTCVGILSNVPNILSTFFPNLAPYLYHFTDAVNVNAYLESQGVNTDAERNGGMAGMGTFLEICLVAYYPIYTWWRPARWWVPVASFFCFGAVIAGGYRSNLVIFGFIFMLAMWCYCSWRSFVILPVVLLALFGLSICVQSGLVDLPPIMQRSLSFLPGKWDATAVESTTASNDFRQNIINVYKKENLYKSPWIGNGFTFDGAEQAMFENMSKTSETPDHYYTAKAFITGKAFHTGWISLYDGVGLIGSAAFVALGVGMIVKTILFVWRHVDHHSPLFPLKVWLLCGIAREFVGFFTVYGDIRATFPNLCAYAIVLIQLDRIERGWNVKTVVSTLQQKDNIPTPGRIVPQPSFLRPN